MKKGNFGFNLWFYPAIAFALVIFDQILLCGVVMVLAIVAEKDDWTSRQTVSAFLLALVKSVVGAIAGVAGVVVAWIPLLGGLVVGALGVITAILSIIVILLAVASILKVIRGEEAKLPVITGVVNKIFD